ncbi:hypothetical protein [Herbiconiux liangxiaofengii]|uniref:hypothetical protein n=1 Tax=Herbiconiux liangxiaofengii TaxID=3342795 RepID=UPI0035B8A389
MPPLLTARQLFVMGVVLTTIGSALALVTDGWLALLFESADFPHAVAGSIAILVREITMTLGLVLVGVSFLARRLEDGSPSSGDSRS